MTFLSACYDDSGRAGTGNTVPAAAQKSLQIHDFRLHSTIIQHRQAAAGKCCHHQVLCGPHAGISQPHMTAPAPSPAGNFFTFLFHRKTKLPQSGNMYVNRPAPDTAASRPVYNCFFCPCQKAAQQKHRGPELYHQFPWNRGAGYIPAVYGKTIFLPADSGPQRPENVRHGNSISNPGTSVDFVNSALAKCGRQHWQCCIFGTFYFVFSLKRYAAFYLIIFQIKHLLPLFS